VLERFIDILFYTFISSENLTRLLLICIKLHVCFTLSEDDDEEGRKQSSSSAVKFILFVKSIGIRVLDVDDMLLR
jgi:hypothetical protein